MTSMNIHNVSTARIERREYNGTRWTQVEFTCANGAKFTVALHGPEGRLPEVIDLTSPVCLTGTVYEPTGYREDMVNAGPGHLLGE